MAITPLQFTGLSQFSNDFQTILNRAVSIAQLPITALQNQQSNLLQEKQLATSLEGVVSDLASSVTNLGAIGSSQGLTASSSDRTKVAINSSSLTTPVSYAITNITSVAKAASESTAIGYANATTAAVASTGSVQLMVGGHAVGDPISMDADHNNLTALRDAINAIPDSGVTASILSTGTGATPYYLALSANTTGESAIQLMDGTTNLLTANNSGANAEFDVNGAHVISQSNVISSVIPGVTFTILDQTEAGETVTLSASSQATSISSALQDFVTKYNAVAAQLNAQIGPTAGMLNGNSLIYGLQAALHSLVNYNGTGTIKSLTELGIEMDDKGTMSFNQSTFNALSGSQIADAFTFLGSATTGFGKLAGVLTQFSDPVSGAIQAQQDQFDATYDSLNDQVNTMTDRVNQMQASLSAKLQAADAQVAQMQSQQQLLTATIQGLNFASFGYQNNNNSSSSSSTSFGG